MKYIPRLTNFADLQGEIAVEVVKNVDNIKDTIARILDDYLEGVMSEHLKETDAYIVNSDDRIEIHIIFGFFTAKLESGDLVQDVLSKTFYLDELLDDMDDFAYSGSALKRLRDQLNEMIREIDKVNR